LPTARKNVVTGLEDEDIMEKWWERNHESLEASQIVMEGHTCLTTLKDEDVNYHISELVRKLQGSFICLRVLVLYLVSTILT
jgi:hypothetical protein